MGRSTTFRTRSRLAALVVAVVVLAAACWTPSETANTYAVVVTSDIVYGQGEVGGGGTFTDLELDLYAPQGTGQTELPLVVVIHGGGFVSGSKTQSNVVAWARAFASRGYLVASIDYRLQGTNPVPSERVATMYDAVVAAGAGAQGVAAVAAIDDTLTAMDFLLARPDTAANQTVLVGGSAGAVTADYVAYALDDFGIERPPVAAVVSNWGGFPVGTASAYIQNPPVQAEPLFWEPPIFLAHATGDPTVPYSLSTDIVAQADAVGLENELFTRNAAVHGFDLATTPYPGGGSVLDAQVRFVTCHLYPHLQGTDACTP